MKNETLNKDREASLSKALCAIYPFIGIYDFEENSFFCLENNDPLIGVAAQTKYDDFMEKIFPYVYKKDWEQVIDCFQKDKEKKNTERIIHILGKDSRFRAYRLYVAYECTGNASECMLLMQNAHLQEEVQFQDYMSMVSKLAFSKMYVLIGARDTERKFYENIYDAENMFQLPHICDFEMFSEQIDKAIYPEDRAVYQKYLRNCDKEENTKANFRMYDSDGKLHYYQGITCRIRMQVGEKHLFMLRNLDQEYKNKGKKEKDKENEKLILDMLKELSYGFDTLLHVNLKTEEYYVYEKRDSDKKAISFRNHFWKQCEERIFRYCHEEDMEGLQKIFSVSFMQQYFLKHEMLEHEYRRMNDEGGYDWIRMVARRVDGNKRVRDIVICLVIVPEEHSKNLTDRMKDKYLCDLLENQNEYLNNNLKKIALENERLLHCLRDISCELNISLQNMKNRVELVRGGLLKKGIKETEMEEQGIGKIVYMLGNLKMFLENFFSARNMEKDASDICYEKITFQTLLNYFENIVRIESEVRRQHFYVQMIRVENDLVKMALPFMGQILTNLLLYVIRSAEEGSTVCLTISKTQTLRNNRKQYLFAIENNSAIHSANKYPAKMLDKGDSAFSSDDYKYLYQTAEELTHLLHGNIFYSNQGSGNKITLSFELVSC